MTAQYRAMLGGLTLFILLAATSAYGSQRVAEGTIVITGRIVSPPLLIQISEETVPIRGITSRPQTDIDLRLQGDGPVSASVDLQVANRSASAHLACATTGRARHPAPVTHECYFGEHGGRTTVVAASGTRAGTTVVRVSYD